MMASMNRTFQILRALELRLAFAAQALADELGVSAKTVAKEVADLNGAFVDAAYISLSKGIYRLAIYDRERYLLVKNTLLATERSFNDAGVRRGYIFQRLAELERPVIADVLASEMSVSRSTVNADIAKLRELVVSYGVAIEGKPNSGIRLLGSEMSVRLMVLDHFYADFFDISPIPNAFYEQMVDVALSHQLEIAAIESLERWFTVLIDRVSHGFALDELPAQFDELASTPAHGVARELVGIAQELTQEALPEAEALFLTLPLVVMRGPDDVRGLARFVYRERAEALYRHIQDHIRQETGLSLPFESLHEEFMVHLGFLLNRVRFSVQLAEDSSGLRAIRYPLAFQLAHLAADVVEQDTGAPVAPAEVALLAAYFQVSLDAFYSRARQQLRIAVVYRHGKIEGHLLRGQVGAALPGVGSVTAIHQDALANTDEQDYDLAIAHPGMNQKTALPLIEVADQVDPRELRKAIDTLSIQRSGGLKGAFAEGSWLTSLLTTNLFFELGSSTYPEQLTELLGLLQETGVTGESFTDAMLAREQQATMRLTDRLSFPHVGIDGPHIVLALGVHPGSHHLLVLAGLPRADREDNSAALVGLYQEVIALSHDADAITTITSFTAAHQFRAFMATRTTNR